MLKIAFKSIALALLIVLIGCSSDDSGSSVTPEPEVEDLVTLNVTDCLFGEEVADLEVMTWNLEQFPKDNSTINAIADILGNLQVDIIALQEIRNRAKFEELVAALDGWEGQLVVSSGLNLGYIYRSAAISVITNAGQILIGDNNAFPRPPVRIKVSHTNGLEVTLINLHLKCCDGSEDRRQAASEQLKAYIDENLPSDNVIVLGDYNDLIIESDPANNVFKNLINDSTNYKFADMDLAANGAQASFPSWPSHLDHILVTNELFDNIKAVETLTLDVCDDRYDPIVSDHRPVLIQLKADE